MENPADLDAVRPQVITATVLLFLIAHTVIHINIHQWLSAS